MAFRESFTFFLAFLSFFFLSTTSTPASATPHLVVVDIRDDLANYTHVPLALSCDQGSSTDLQQGDHYNLNLTVTEDHQDFECTATWLRWFATWDAYEAKRDEGHDTVYWLVNEDGFHHSWDASKWKLMEHWHTD